MSFSEEYNHPIDHLIPNLPNLEVMILGIRFDQQIKDFPPKLKRLEFVSPFDHPIKSLPPTLIKLALGWKFNQSIEFLKDLHQLVDLDLDGFFNQPISNGSISYLPPSLISLSFSANFNQPIEALKDLHELVELHFGGSFNQPLSNRSYVASGSNKRAKLSAQCYLPKVATLSHGELLLPPNLKSLSFGGNFNQPIDSLQRLKHLEKLSFGLNFKQPIVNLPDSITNLTLPLKNLSRVINLPASLRELFIFGCRMEAVELNDYIPNRTDFDIRSDYYCIRKGISVVNKA